MELKKQGKFIIIVLDGLGVGALPLTSLRRPADSKSHTLLHVIEKTQIDLPNLHLAGVIDYFLHKKFYKRKFIDKSVSLGKCSTYSEIPDSYLAHQEMAGLKLKKPNRELLSKNYLTIINELRKNQYKNLKYISDCIFIEDNIVISNNIETDAGMVINVIGNTLKVHYSQILKVGKIVRKLTQNSRIIIMGGFINGFLQKCISNVDSISFGEISSRGVNVPKLQIYNENYRVTHVGFRTEVEKQVADILLKKNIPVTLIGKTAQVIQAENADKNPCVDTKEVLQATLAAMSKSKYGFIWANIQETDLSGHSQDSFKYATILKTFDNFLPLLVEKLGNHDILVITGDHGNDPTIGHSQHTWEYTPIITFSNKKPLNYKTRKSLADIGQTVSQFFNVQKTQYGKSLFS